MFDFNIVDNDRLQLTLPTGKSFTVQDIMQAIAESEYADWKIFTEAVEELTHPSTTTEQATTSAIIAKRIDSNIHIDISEDQMGATLSITRAYGGKIVTLKDLLLKLKSHNILFGIDEVSIFGGLERYEQEGQLNPLPIAFGREPVNGDDARLDRLVPLISERAFAPPEDEASANSKVDIRDLGKIPVLKPGVCIMKKINATLGRDGITIHNSPVPAIAGKDVVLVAGKNTRLEDNALYVTKTGHPVEILNGMTIDDTLQVDDVNLRQGHIDFDGTVHVKGNVEPNMRITASGNVIVDGYVDCATITAGADILVASGIISRKDKDDKPMAKLTAKGTIAAQFCQYAQLSAGKDIKISTQLQHSECVAKQHIVVQSPFGKLGEIIGGKLLTGFGINAGKIGSVSSSATFLTAAGAYQPMKQKLAMLIEKQTAHFEQKSIIERNIKKLEKIAQPKAQQQLATHKQHLQTLQIFLHNLNKQILELEGQLNSFFQHNRIEIDDTLFPNVMAEINQKSTKSTRTYAACNIQYQEGKTEIISNVKVH